MMSALVSCIGEDDLDSKIPDESSEVLQAVDPIEEPTIKEIVDEPELQSTRLGDIEVKSLMNESETEETGTYAFISTTKNKITSYNLIKFFVKDISKLAGTDYLLIDLHDGTALHKVAGASMLTYGPYESGNDRLSSKWEDIIVNTTDETVIGELYDGVDLSHALFPNIQEPEVSEPVEVEPEVVVDTPEVVEEPEVVIETPQFEFFANCTELRVVHPNGVDSTHAAYQSKMDRDKDGFACD
ncbi:excalibur calcium-binding domain-containing protein [Exiguobacterium sp. SH0S1]|nr:excalibur calcium-binding domain-containing protein [Exiguobacterium sp. SH0S1]